MRGIRATMCAVAGAMLAASPGTALAHDEVDQAIRDRLHLSDYTLQDLALPPDAMAGFDVFVSIGGVEQLLSLEPWSLRSPSFRVLVDDGSGDLVEHPAPAPRTFRGHVAGVEGSIVAGSLLDDGLTVKIIMPDEHGHVEWYVQPLAAVIEGQPWQRHVVFSDRDTVAPEGLRCGVEDHHHFGHGHAAPDGGGTGVASNFLYLTEIAYDADFAFYQLNGSSVANTIADIENVQAVVTTTYERDIQITYEITTVIVRTTSGLYNTNDPNTMLNQFRNQWNTNHRNVHRDIAHLMTGRNLNGGVIGIAWLSVICASPINGNGYGLSQSRFSQNMNLRAALTAHELGHNWSAGHCNNSPPCHIMCSGINGCQGIGNPIRFGPTAINQIRNHRNTRNCLDVIKDGMLDLPFFDDFPASTIDPDKWPVNNGATIVSDPAAPSPPRVLRLDFSDSIETATLGAGGAQQPLVFSFYEAHLTVEPCRGLFIEGFNQSGNWVEIGRVIASGQPQAFLHRGFTVPSEFLYDGVKFRLRVNGTQFNDAWLIDDVLIEANGTVPPKPAITLPFFHTFPCDSFDADVWAATTNGATITSSGINEPSPPYSMQLRLLGSADTAPIRAASFGSPDLYLSFFLQERLLSPGDAITLFYRNTQGLFVFLDAISSPGGSQSEYFLHEFKLPAEALHDNLSIRFQANGSGDKAWLIDDIRISDEPLVVQCPADLNGDGQVDAEDFFIFLDWFAAGDARADLNGDGEIDAADFFMYLDLFAQGCD